MTEPSEAVPQTTEPDDEPRTLEAPVTGDNRPVSDGPARHHANADPTHSAAPQARTSHRF